MIMVLVITVFTKLNSTADKEEIMATIYELEKRLGNLENLVNYLSKQITDMKQYSDADMAGARQGISNVTPTTYTKTAYIGDTEVIFTDVVFGNLNVYINNSDGYYPDYKVSRNNDRITIVFDAPLLYVTTVTISIV